jgi:hypothetical protein
MEWKESERYTSGLQTWTHSEADSKDISIHTFWSTMGFTVETSGGQTPCIKDLESAKIVAESFIVARRLIDAKLEESRQKSEELREAARVRRRARDKARRAAAKLAASKQD